MEGAADGTDYAAPSSNTKMNAFVPPVRIRVGTLYRLRFQRLIPLVAGLVSDGGRSGRCRGGAASQKAPIVGSNERLWLEPMAIAYARHGQHEAHYGSRDGGPYTASEPTILYKQKIAGTRAAPPPSAARRRRSTPRRQLPRSLGLASRVGEPLRVGEHLRFLLLPPLAPLTFRRALRLRVGGCHGQR